MAQIKLLNTIGMLYCGDGRLHDLALKAHGELVDFCLQDWDQTSIITAQNLDAMGLDAESEWKDWAEAESRRRTGYCIWVRALMNALDDSDLLQLLDTMLAFQFTHRPALTLNDADQKLPCHEKLWDCPSALDWQHYSKKPSRTYAIELALIDADRIPSKPYTTRGLERHVRGKAPSPTHRRIQPHFDNSRSVSAELGSRIVSPPTFLAMGTFCTPSRPPRLALVSPDLDACGPNIFPLAQRHL